MPPDVVGLPPEVGEPLAVDSASDEEPAPGEVEETASDACGVAAAISSPVDVEVEVAGPVDVAASVSGVTFAGCIPFSPDPPEPPGVAAVAVSIATATVLPAGEPVAPWDGLAVTAPEADGMEIVGTAGNASGAPPKETPIEPPPATVPLPPSAWAWPTPRAGAAGSGKGGAGRT